MANAGQDMVIFGMENTNLSAHKLLRGATIQDMEPQYFFNFGKLAYVSGPRPEGCILCAIGRHDRTVVDLSIAESQHFLAAVNLYPFNPGHLLIFPKRHLLKFQDFNPAEILDLHKISGVLLDILETTYQAHGFNIGWNLGPVAGASIEHIHQHIIPRFPREIGMAELIAGHRALVEDPRDTATRLRKVLDVDGRLTALRPD